MKPSLLLSTVLFLLLDSVLPFGDYGSQDYEDDYPQRWLPTRQRYGRRGYGRRQPRRPHVALYASLPEMDGEEGMQSAVCEGDPLCENRIRNYAALDEDDLSPEGAARPQPRSKAEVDAEQAKRHQDYENALKTGEAKAKEDLEAVGGPDPYGGYLLKMTLSEDM